MLKSLLRFEESVARVEGRLLTVIVIVMLTLAVYNVFYRNALVPLQSSILTPDEETAAPETAKSEAEPPPTEDGSTDEAGFGGGFDDSADGFGGGFDDSADGFGGGFDDDPPEDESDEAPDEPEEIDPADGFGGEFGDSTGGSDGPASEDGSDESPDKPEEIDPADGFGGEFGDSTEGFGGGFGGGFDNGDKPAPADKSEISPVEPASAESPLSGFDQFIVDLVDTLKIEWIDVLLRQLVLFVGFLGAMLASRRRKHITIDALTKVIPEKSLPYVHAFTSALSAIVCIILAISGWKLVEISLEYPKELMSWADESTFQMVFPIGFGLLTFHFVLRTLVSVAEIITGEDADEALRGEL